MNGIHQNGKNRSSEKTHPGCLGRMVNLFELNIGMPASKLLSDKPHQDGSSLSRSRTDVSRMRPSGGPIEDKVIVPEINNTLSDRKSNGTPMKMLIAQEMSKEINSRRNPPNLVAKLMGLDTLPLHQPDPPMQRNHSRGHPRSHSDIPMSDWEQQKGLFHYVEPNEYKDVYEIWQKSQNSAHKGRYEENTMNKNMDLVRQKFIEAKRLSMDTNLRQSKQFQDALEVLSSNRDLFIKCLQEPKSVFSQNLDISIPKPETKRITVLRPSKMADSNKFSGAGNKNGNQLKKGPPFIQPNELEKSHPESSLPANWNNCTNPTEPIRIVVLKPSFVRPHTVNAVCSPQSSPKTLHHEDYLGDVEEDDNQESRKVAKAITHRMRKKIGNHSREETLTSSVLSNGYAGDESSFDRSEIEFADSNLSDSEIMSQVSRHSWDCVNRLGSPYASSSFSRAPYSPESSVCREAKKRLSERWTMMSSNGSYREQRHVRTSSSTLGEMLALSATKTSNSQRDENVDNPPRNFTRSKSVPVSFTELGNRLDVAITVSDKGKLEGVKEDVKAKSVGLSFKGKVSSLFFSRNKIPCKKSENKDEFDSFSGQISSDKTKTITDEGCGHTSPRLSEQSCDESFSNLIGKKGIISPETELTEAKPITSGKSGETQDQLSPISVLDAPFEEHGLTDKDFPHYLNPSQHGVEPSLSSIASNLIDKSPPIGSISRTLSRYDDSCIYIASSTDEEEQEWFFYVKALLSVAGLQDEVQSNSFFARWHSPESPLNPSLRDNYVDLKDKETFLEAKQKQNRSTMKLVFDCVNEALIDISEYRLGSGQHFNSCIVGHNSLGGELWAQMKDLFSSKDKCVWGEFGDDDNDRMVERVVKKEVEGKGWISHLRLEMGNLGNEIEGKLLEELLQEVVVELELTDKSVMSHFITLR